MSFDTGLTLQKVGRNEYEVGTINLSSEHREVLLRTTNLHLAVARVEKELRELPYESFAIRGFTHAKLEENHAWLVRNEVRLEKVGSNDYVLEWNEKLGTQGHNLHAMLGQIERLGYYDGTEVHVDLSVSGFCRKPSPTYSTV